MADDTNRLAVLIEANTKSYENAMKRLEQKTDRAMKKAGADTRKLSREMSRLEKAGASAASNIGRRFAALVAVGSVVRLGTHFLSVGADIEEMESKFNAVFKNLSGEVDAWANSHAALVSRSALDLKSYLSTLQDTFVPLGFARDKGAALSKQLVELAIDVASFSNAAEPDVINNFTSAIVGNHEAVRRFGIVITESTLKAELMRMGIKGGTREASEQQKVLARLALITRSTSDAQGDAAKTADSYTNKMKGLNAAWKEHSAAIGAFLTGPGGTVADYFAKALRQKTLFWESFKNVEDQSIASLMHQVSNLESELATLQAQRQRVMEKKLFNRVDQANVDTYTQKINQLAERHRIYLAQITAQKRIQAATSDGVNINREGKGDKPFAAVDPDRFRPSSIFDEITKDLQSQSKSMISTFKAEVESVDPWEGLRESTLKVNKDMETQFSQTSSVMDSAFSSWIDHAIDGTFKFSDAIGDLSRQMLKLFANQAFNSIIGGFALPGLSPGVATGPPVQLGRGMAGGGTVAAGVPRMVGERGPEMFVPRTAGSVVPNQMMKGGGGQTIVNIQNHSGAPVRENRRSSGGNSLVDIVIGAVNEGVGSGKMDQAMGQRFGTNPVGRER